MHTDVCIVYNEPLPGTFEAAGEGAAVASVIDAVRAVTEAVRETGCSVLHLPVTSAGYDVVRHLRELNPGVIFNLFEGFDHDPESEGNFAHLLEKSGIAFTGAPSRALIDCIDKAKTKSHLRSMGLPTADWQLYQPGLPVEPSSPDLRFPCIVKPLATDASHGLTAESLVSTFPEMREQVERIHALYGQAALVEEFLPGREFNLLIMGPPLRIFPVAEISYALSIGKPRMLTYASKWEENDEYFVATQVLCPAPLSQRYTRTIELLGARTFTELVGRGYARIDMRTDRAGQVMVLEVNPNPDIGPASGAKREAEASGMSYQDFLREILEQAHPGPAPDTIRGGASAH